METVSALSERRRHGLHMHRGDRSVLGGQIVYIRGFSGRGDSFPEHKRHISMVLMIVLKYLAGQFFFLTCKSREFHTVGHHDRYEAKGLKALWGIGGAMGSPGTPIIGPHTMLKALWGIG